MKDKQDSVLLAELEEQKRKVDFDTFDISVRQLIDMVSSDLIDVAPAYQRQFRWEDERQSSFVESVMLGIPIPSLFTAANSDGSWELIDGVQRLSTLVRFAGGGEGRKKLSIRNELKLQFDKEREMNKLNSFHGMTFETLPKSIQLQFLLKPIKVTTISDKSDFNVRFDLFERLNTGGVQLTPQEIRSCVFGGEFNEFLRELAQNEDFNKVVFLPKGSQNNGTREELVLRFFAFLYRYQDFDHSVIDFLNKYMKDSSRDFNYSAGRKIFEGAFDIIATVFPHGINRGRKVTPVNLYEAVAVGAGLALSQNPNLKTQVKGWRTDPDWLASADLRKFTTAATNSSKMVRGRIEFCKKKFLGE